MRLVRRPARLIGIGIALACFVGCGDDPKPITIGAALPLTGSRAVQATAAQRGYETWTAIVNDSGGLLGRQVKLVIRDFSTDPDDTQWVAQSEIEYEALIVDDKVDLVFGTVASTYVIPTSAVVDKHGYAYVEPAGGSTAVFNRGLKNIFFAQPAAGSQQGVPFVAYIKSLRDQGTQIGTYAIVTSNTSFQLSVMAEIRTGLNAAGLTEVVGNFTTPYNPTPGQNDPPLADTLANYASQLASLTPNPPDLLVGGTSLEDGIAQVKAYKAAGYQPDGAFMTSAPSFPEFRTRLEADGASAEDIFAATAWFPQAEEFQNAEFVARFIEEYGGTASDIAEDAANAFTVGQVVQQAVENIRSIDNAALITELHAGTYETIVGPLSFDADGRPQGSFLTLQWRGPNFVIVGPAGREQAPPQWPKAPW